MNPEDFERRDERSAQLREHVRYVDTLVDEIESSARAGWLHSPSSAALAALRGYASAVEAWEAVRTGWEIAIAQCIVVARAQVRELDGALDAHEAIQREVAVATLANEKGPRQ